MSKINVAIIGANFGAKVHLPAFQSIEDVNIVGVYDSKNNCRDIIADKNIQAVCLSVPPLFSYDLLKTAITHKKHIFCEKPLSSNLENAQEIANLLTDDIITAINFEICESKIVKKLKNIIEDKTYGLIKNFMLSWRIPNSRIINFPNHWKDNINKGGGVINNFGSHIFNLLEYLFSKQIINIEKEFLSDSLENNNEISLITDFNLFTGTIYISSQQKYAKSKFFLMIQFERGTLLLENNNNILKNFSLVNFNGMKFIIDEEKDNSNKDGRIDLTNSLAQKFINGINTNTQIRPNIYDGLRVQKLIDKVINNE